MERHVLIYAIYTILLLAFMALVALTPYFGFSDAPLAGTLYSAFAPTCHQKLSRSLCLFPEGFPVGDCTQQGAGYVRDDRANLSGVRGGVAGYKFPVCSRDIGIYGFMLLGALAYPLIFRLDNRNVPPPMLLVAALVPIALDGGFQFLSDLGINLLGFPYESTNTLRVITGGIAGFAASIYVIPILNRLFN